MAQQAMLQDLTFVVATERSMAPRDAEAFARAIIRAICSASVTPGVGQRTYERCLRALMTGATARLGFRHPGKAEAVDRIWRERHQLYGEYLGSADKLAFLSTLPWIGPVTRRALAFEWGLMNLAVDRERLAVA